MAAQLGKVLLERNKDLEEQVRQAQVVQYEQVREIEVTLTRIFLFNVLKSIPNVIHLVEISANRKMFVHVDINEPTVF